MQKKVKVNAVILQRARVDMELLPHRMCGTEWSADTSQKGEVATLDKMRKKSKDKQGKSDWDDDEVDVFS